MLRKKGGNHLPETIGKDGCPRMLFELDGIPFVLQKPADLGFLRPYGRCFRIWDRGNSGNLCFGMEGPYGKLFIKYAGARPERYMGRPGAAEELLQKAAAYYQPSQEGLTRLLSHGRTSEGYALVFAYEEGAALSGDPLYPDMLDRLLYVPTAQKLRMAETLFSLMLSLEKRNLMAVDLSEENLILNLGQGTLTLCDIDQYRPFPFRCVGRQPGSPRWQAPEEKKEDETLDARTAVYRLGMIAFDLFALGNPRKREVFETSTALLDVACRAADPDRGKRYPNVEVFLDAWRKAVGETPV